MTLRNQPTAGGLGPASQGGVSEGLKAPGVRGLKEPASESQLGMALMVSAIVMALMLWAILWEAGIIEEQRQLIKALSMTRFGGMG